ncbi:MAG: PHP domain-containing protein [bacterium]
MVEYYADLHIHTSYSDGVCSPAEVVDIAIASKISAIAITDHDSVAGIDEAISHAKDKVHVIPAVELSANIGNQDIHILGFYIDHHSPDLLDYLAEFRQHRITRAKKIVENLARDGIKIDFILVEQIAHNSTMGRPHIAEALLKFGYVHNRNEAFHRYLGYHSQYYVPKKEISPKKVIHKIKEWGGVPVLAHPGMVGDIVLVYKLIRDGVLGIEVWHPEHTRKQEDDFYEIAMKHGLVMTGGSDFHGYPRGYCKIGDCGCYLKEIQYLNKCAGKQYC